MANEEVFLNDAWKLYYHSPDDDDWRLESYVSIGMISTVADLWTMVNTVQPWMKDAMFFLHREGISPVWDDPAVVDGGCYSIRVPREHATTSFVDMMIAVTGETVLAEDERDKWQQVCGVSISPKNAFNVIKLWMSDADPPDKCKVWMPAMRSEEVFFSLFRESIIRSKKPITPLPAIDEATPA